MKRTLLTAACAALALGAAQALNIDWSGATSVKTNASKGSHTLALNGATAWSAKVTLTLGDTFSLNQYPQGSNQRYPGIFGIDGSSYLMADMYNSSADANGEISAGNLAGSATAIGSAKLQAGQTYELTLSCNGEMLALYVNDTLIATTTTIPDGNPVINWGQRNSTGNAPLANGSNADTGDVVFSGLTVKTGVAVVPEPTALALLALGVAGVALRRRVA